MEKGLMTTFNRLVGVGSEGNYYAVFERKRHIHRRTGSQV